MFKSNYYLQARLFPTILTSIPLLVLINAIVAPMYSDQLKEIFVYLPPIINTTFSAAIIFLFVQINRMVSKEVFQKLYFTDEIKMPTTSYILWNNPEYPDNIKSILREKVKASFNIELLSRDEEAANELNARKMIVTACSQMRNAVRDNQLLLQHNIEYGFWRNLIGGCFIAAIFCIALVGYGYFQHNQLLLRVGLILLGIYCLPLLFSRFIINRYGHYYAKILIEQFITPKS